MTCVLARRCSVVLFAAAVILAGWAMFPDRKRDVAYPEQPFEASDQELADWPIGVSKLSFKVKNRSDFAAKLVGMEENCAKNCCWKSRLTSPIVIGPRGSVTVECEFTVARHGAFEARVPLHIYQNGLHRVEVLIRGNGVKSHDATPRASE